MNQFTIDHTGYSADPSWYSGVTMRWTATTRPVATRKTDKIRLTMSMIATVPPLGLIGIDVMAGGRALRHSPVGRA